MSETPHVDVVTATRALLLQEFPTLTPARVGEWPGVKETYDPYYVAITELSGFADYFEQSVSVDIDVFAPTRAVAKMWAFDIQLMLLRYPWSVSLGANSSCTIDSVTCDSTPKSMPWDDEAIRRQGATYNLTLRR